MIFDTAKVLGFGSFLSAPAQSTGLPDTGQSAASHVPKLLTLETALFPLYSDSLCCMWSTDPARGIRKARPVSTFKRLKCTQDEMEAAPVSQGIVAANHSWVFQAPQKKMLPGWSGKELLRSTEEKVNQGRHCHSWRGCHATSAEVNLNAGSVAEL